MKNMKRLITLFIALAMVGIVQAEETTLQGTVIDQDGKPIEGAIVSGSEQYLDDSINTVETTTDSNGRFSLQMEWPDWIDVKADGYAPFKTDLYYNLKNNKIIVLYNAVDYKAGEMSSIVLPITPNKELGRYFRYDRIEEKRDLVFEREFNPQPNTPYIFIPYQDVHIDLTGMDFSAEINNIEDTYGVSFIGSYSSIAPLLMDNYEYWSIGNDGADTYNEMSDRDTVFCLPKAMHATLLLNFAYLRANNQLINNGFPEIVLHDPDEDDHPFVEEGKKWECTISWGLIETNIKKQYYSISGDTIVNGITCKKLHGPYSTYAVYEKDGKVYCHEKVNGDFHLLYDFTCHEGDVVNVVNPEGQTEWGLDEYRCTIKKVDTIITKSGHRLKRFTLQAENLEIEFGSEEEYVWIEGVGSPWEPLYPVGYWELSGGSSYLNACYVNGEQLFVGKDIYYGTGISPIQNSKFIIHNGADAIYDFSGRRVVNPKRGLYIQGNKKIIR
jgi:hypothetical protein